MALRLNPLQQLPWLPILSGILIGTSYIPFPPWAYPFCFVPLWLWWWKQSDLRSVIWGGWVTQFFLTLIGFNWVAHTVHEFGHLPWPIAIVCLLGFCSFANIFVPVAGALWFWLQRRLPLPDWAKIALLPILTILSLEYIPTIFPWNFGYPWMWAGLPGFQVADLIGFRGLSAVTIGVNALLIAAWIYRRQKEKASFALVTFVSVLMGINLVGWWRAARLPQADRKVPVLIVQANIGNLEKQYAEAGWGFRWRIVERYMDLTDQGLKSPEGEPSFAVWPENAYPDSLETGFTSASHATKLQEFLRQNNLALVTGAYGLKQSTNQVTTAFFTIDGQGALTDTPYAKTHLLAFGEYFPGAEWFPILRKWVPAVGNFGRGNGPEVKSLLGLKLGPQICYESLFPSATVALANQGAEILINITNDSWYGTWQEPYQHLYMTLARGIEVRRPLIRSTNTGISTVVTARGEVLAQSPLHEEWFSVYQVPYVTNPESTFYQRFPLLLDVVLWSAMALILSFCWGLSRRRKVS